MQTFDPSPPRLPHCWVCRAYFAEHQRVSITDLTIPLCWLFAQDIIPDAIWENKTGAKAGSSDLSRAPSLSKRLLGKIDSLIITNLRHTIRMPSPKAFTTPCVIRWPFSPSFEPVGSGR